MCQMEQPALVRLGINIKASPAGPKPILYRDGVGFRVLLHAVNKTRETQPRLKHRSGMLPTHLLRFQ